MLIYAIGIQYVVKTKTKHFKSIFNTPNSHCLLFQIFIRPCSSPTTVRFEPDETMTPFLSQTVVCYQL